MRLLCTYSREFRLQKASALAQVQLRDIAGFVDTRATILQLKPGTKSHWISFAIAHHLNGSHDIAAEALKKYEGLQVLDTSNHCLAIRHSSTAPTTDIVSPV